MDGTGSVTSPRVLREVTPERREVVLGIVGSGGDAASRGTWLEFGDPTADDRDPPDAVMVLIRSAPNAVKLAVFRLAAEVVAGTAIAAAHQLVVTLRRSDATLVHCSLRRSDTEIREALIAAGFLALIVGADHSHELLILQL